MYTDAPDAPLAVEVDATAVVTRGPHAGATGTVESVGNGWIRLRTADGRVVAARGREAVGAGARRDRVRRHFNVSVGDDRALGSERDALCVQNVGL